MTFTICTNISKTKNLPMIVNFDVKQEITKCSYCLFAEKL